MSALAIARKDFRDAIRSRTLIAMTVLFTLFYAGLTYLYTVIASLAPQSPSTLDIVPFLSGPASTLVAIVGLLAGYKAIAGERESGSIKLLLGLPHSRRDVVLGKVLGRAAVVTISTLIGFVAAAIVAVLRYGSFSAGSFASFTLLTVVLALVFVSIGVGVSAATGSTNRAVLGVIGVFLIFQFLWSRLPSLVNYLVNGSYQFTSRPPDWAYLIVRLNPRTAYQDGLVGEWILGNASQQAFVQAFGGNAPVFLSPWFAVVVLAIWLVVPAAVGYLRFESTDL